MNRKVGRALFSGARAKEMSEAIAAVQENTDVTLERVEDMTFIKAQVSAINGLRDKLVHQGSHIAAPVRLSDGARLVHNAHRYRRKGAHFEMHVTHDVLRAVISDLFRLHQMLMNHTQKNFRKLSGSGDASTWLYKSAQPDTNRHKSRADQSKRARPPRPSQKSPRKEA